MQKRLNRSRCGLGLSAVSCGRTAEPIDLPFGLWTQVGRKKNTCSIIFANATEPSMCHSDAACCQITLTTCYQYHCHHHHHHFHISLCTLSTFWNTGIICKQQETKSRDLLSFIWRNGIRIWLEGLEFFFVMRTLQTSTTPIKLTFFYRCTAYT